MMDGKTCAHKAIMMRTCLNDFLKDWILEILHEIEYIP